MTTMARMTAIALALAVTLGQAGSGRAEPGSAPAGAAPGYRHEIEISFVGERLVEAKRVPLADPMRRTGAGVALGYGYFTRPWLRLDAQAQGDATFYSGSLDGISGWLLGGASICSMLGQGGGEALLFAGLHLGAGFTLDDDSDGGPLKLRRALVVAPRAGILLPLGDRLGLHAYVEYQWVDVDTESGYVLGSRHLFRGAVGITAAF